MATTCFADEAGRYRGHTPDAIVGSRRVNEFVIVHYWPLTTDH
jgi:hypothetical protein